MSDTPAPVSFDSEHLILVDELDQAVGSASKMAAHQPGGTLHRAFSIFLFGPNNVVLLQQRSSSKPLWPGYWSNSCCSHPRVGETYEQATQRRVREELGVGATLEKLYQFEYRAHYRDLGTEHELCSVYVGQCHSSDIAVHPEEIGAWGWFNCDHVDVWTRSEPDAFTPWFLMEWSVLRGTYFKKLEPLLQRKPFVSRTPLAI